MEYKIRNGQASDIDALKLLWEDVFGDDEKYIDRFFEDVFTSGQSFVAEDNNTPVGMMYVLPSTLIAGNDVINAGYIYAVATDKNYRGQNIMKSLEQHACMKSAEKDISVLALVPAEKSLFDMYRKIGYHTGFYKSRTVIAPFENKTSELYDCSLGQFLEYRSEMLSKQSGCFEFCDSIKNYRYNVLKETCEILLYKDAETEGYIVGQKCKNDYVIFETSLTLEKVCNAANYFKNKYDKIYVEGKNGTLTPYGMLKSIDKRIKIEDIIKFNPYMSLMLE